MAISYKGFKIERSADGEGLFWLHGGFCEHYSEIDDFITEEQAHYADIDTPPDTPSLPERFPY